jgi:hypothetical protein
MIIVEYHVAELSQSVSAALYVRDTSVNEEGLVGSLVMNQPQWDQLVALLKAGGVTLAGPDQGADLCDFDNPALRVEQYM